ncbi:MAG: KH domain-containing protein [Oscillospiraceae bacterium]|nr:KH domain-containing protein [Oscillospiraceae bacterium]
MTHLLKVIARGLVENPDDVEVDADEVNEDGVKVYHLHVASEDMGRVIGKQGRIATAIRTVLRAAARNGPKIQIEIN